MLQYRLLAYWPVAVQKYFVPLISTASGPYARVLLPASIHASCPTTLFVRVLLLFFDPALLLTYSTVL